MSKQDEAKSTPEQIAESMIRGYETDSGVVMGIRWAQIPSLRILLIEAAKRAMEARADDLAKLQADVHRLREDYRDHDNSFKMDLDSRLNKIEADLGDCISRARGETR